MKCKEIERLIIESSPQGLDESARLEMERHLKECVHCCRLEEEMAAIRDALSRQTRPVLPEDLENRTFQLCRGVLASPQSKGEVFSGRIWLKSIPVHMKAAFIFLIGLTIIWAAPLFSEFRLGESLSVASIIILSLIFQNAIMLIFSPLLLRHFRKKRSQLETCSAG